MITFCRHFVFKPSVKNRFVFYLRSRNLASPEAKCDFPANLTFAQMALIIVYIQRRGY